MGKKWVFNKDFPLWNPGGMIPLDPVTGLTWKVNKKVVKPRYMNVLEVECSKKMRV